MKKTKFSEEQIAFALKQAETGTSVDEVCRKMGICQATFYKWKQKYGGLGVSELRRLRQLEEENIKLKQLVADLSLDKAMLQDVLKKSFKACAKREAVKHLQQAWSTSENRACKLIHLGRKTFRYQSNRCTQEPLMRRISEIAYSRVRYGYRRIHILLKREGWQINHKRVHRLYCLMDLNLRHRKPRRHKSSSYRVTRLPTCGINECWSMDFVCDQLFNDTRFRCLTVVDIFTRECLRIEVGKQLKGADVVNVINKILQKRPKPRQIFLDNGSEFISKSLDKWAYENQIALAFSRPGKPTDNCYIESFNRSFRDECLNVHWFLSLEDAKLKAEKWRQDYNLERPHSALNYEAPSVFAAKIYPCHS